MWVKTIWLFLMSEWVMIRLFNTEILCLPNEMKYANIPTSFNGGSRANVAIKKGGGSMISILSSFSKLDNLQSLPPRMGERQEISSYLFSTFTFCYNNLCSLNSQNENDFEEQKAFPKSLFSIWKVTAKYRLKDRVCDLGKPAATKAATKSLSRGVGAINVIRRGFENESYF